MPGNQKAKRSYSQLFQKISRKVKPSFKQYWFNPDRIRSLHARIDHFIVLHQRSFEIKEILRSNRIRSTADGKYFAEYFTES